jgi:hypothetical protein
MAITFAISNLSRPDPSGIRHDPESRGGNLIAAHTPPSSGDDLPGGNLRHIFAS